MTGEQYRYRDPREAVDRANRILINNPPDGVDTIAITQQRDHLPLVTTQTDVASLRKQLAGSRSAEEALRQQRVEPVDTTAFGRGYRIRADRFSYSVKPTLAQSLGGPEDFYMFRGVMASASYWLTDRLLLDGGVFANPITTTTSSNPRYFPLTPACRASEPIFAIMSAMTSTSTTYRPTMSMRWGTASMPRFMAATSKPCTAAWEQRRSGARWIATGRWAWMRITSSSATGTT